MKTAPAYVLILILSLCLPAPAAFAPAPVRAADRDHIAPALPSILLEQAASFLGVPAPRRQGQTGQTGMDEGPGFRQDGAARAAGESASSGLNGLYGAGYGPGHDPLTGHDDDTRGGRRTSGRSRDFSDFDPLRLAQDRALSWGMGFLNSSAESLLSGITDNGRARLNFSLDRDGHFQGEGDALLPFHDSRYTTVFTQIGARSMAVSGGEDDGNDRWIGNFGLGQRWFPNATEEDSGDWMVGYNAFFDNDFTRSHRRGGVGVELQYDWLRLASNYYFPLSGWKGSHDFDSRFIEERPAEGWDARVKAYLPFYRNLALTGAYTQWYGDHVGMFGRRNLEKDPKVWSYGLEYTPFPLLSGFLTQRSTERGRTDTEFGLNFTYHFGMPFEDQIKHSKVAELRAVSGSRHEFVDRENRIILEYRAKNSYRIEYLGAAGPNVFRFRVLNGFDEFMAGRTVHVTADGLYLAEAAPTQPATLFARVVNFLDELISVKAAYAADRSKSYVTDRRGEFLVTLAGASGPVSVTVRAGMNEQTFTLNGSASSLISITSVTDGGDFTSGTLYATASLTAKVVDANGSPVSGATVTWSVISAQNNSPAMMSGWGSKKTGLTWGDKPEVSTTGNVSGGSLTYLELSEERISGGSNESAYNSARRETTTAGNGETTQQLTDIVGERTVTVKAEVTTISGTTYATREVSFGNGPLSVFNAPVGTSAPLAWSEAYDACNGSGKYVSDGVNQSTWGALPQGAYVGGGKMPIRAEYQAVSPYNVPSMWSTANPNSAAQGAAFAAGWLASGFWTGEANGNDYAFYVRLYDGHGGSINLDPSGMKYPVACRR